jgi:hypothetical protein
LPQLRAGRATGPLCVVRQHDTGMLYYDWFLLRSAEDLRGELLPVVQPRKLFLLGTAFLRRVMDLLPAEAERTAVETTEKYAQGRAGFRDLLETWNAAEAD